jgi:hypothetical protein
MIMGTDEPKEIGKTYNARLHMAGVLYPEQPVFVMREVPFEEWSQDIDCPPDSVEAARAAIGDHPRQLGPRIWWYEVSTD